MSALATCSLNTKRASRKAASSSVTSEARTIPAIFKVFFMGVRCFLRQRYNIGSRNGADYGRNVADWLSGPCRRGAGLPAETFGAPDGQAPALSGCKGGDFPEIYYL
ncbi:MAG: hypothetical protein EGR20_24555 [Alistipes onderdonkii]|nr:hypothetical protein [Alistipes onderdonkii]